LGDYVLFNIITQLIKQDCIYQCYKRILTKNNQQVDNHEIDIKLITEILKGSKSAFKDLYKRHAKGHMLTCLRYVKNRSEAEDMLQESYIKIYKDLKKYDSKKSQFNTWSNRVVINTCLMSLRKKNVLKDFDNIIDMSTNLTVDADAVDNLCLQDLTNFITQLPKGYRTVFNMYVIDGYKHPEISEQLGISVSTSKTQLMKAKRMLQGMITSHDYSQSMNYVLR